MEADENTFEVTYGGARAILNQRDNGFWAIRWQEGGAWRRTTRVLKGDAFDYARKKVRELSPQTGSKILTIEDAKLVEQIKRVCGPRSPFGLLDQIENTVKRFGWDAIPRALRHYEDSGLAAVLQVPLLKAVNEMLDWYHKRKKDSETIATLRKELLAFCRSHELLVCDLSVLLIEDWVLRKREDGEDVEKRTINNRLNVWRTFLNWCREQNYWPKGEKHPGELVDRERLDNTIPEIWTVETTRQALACVREHLPKLLNTLVIGCWMGLRPEESKQVKPAAWDWERGYVNLGAEVATKVGQQRFVPIAPNARVILGGKIEDPRDRKKTRGRWDPVCCATDDINHLSKLLRQHKIIEEWIPDVMRHSYISYRIAQGHGMGQVAEWCGNSESEIRKKYRRPLRKEDGEAYFSIGLQAV